jgi:hypothetical protein
MARARNAFLSLPLLLLADPAPQAPTTAPLADLGWLAGTWRATSDDGGFLEETWSAPLGDAMCGMFRSAKPGGAVSLYELMSVELEGPVLPPAAGDGPIIPGQERGGAPQRLVFRIRHFERGLVPWSSEADGPLTMEVRSVAKHRLELEAPTRDFPRTVSYERTGDTLTILLASAQPDGRRLEFVLTRVAN